MERGNEVVFTAGRGASGLRSHMERGNEMVHPGCVPMWGVGCLEGMDLSVPDLSALIEEMVRRMMSGTEEGHMVLSDAKVALWRLTGQPIFQEKQPQSAETGRKQERSGEWKRTMETNNRTDAIHQQIIGDSQMIRHLKDQIVNIARYPWPVLILGESGTGKELAAMALHHLSHRRRNPLVPVNCAGLPDTLMESEFFGYEKGAFTDAKTHRTGKFHEAANGTLLLDEIGEASAKLQLTLLRVLETGRVMRVGSAREERVNVRVVCATNKPIRQLGREMRTDLFHRISSYPLFMPPLRQRREDIPALARHFIRQFHAEFDEQATGSRSPELTRTRSPP